MIRTKIKGTMVAVSLLLGSLIVTSANACDQYTVKSGDGLWNLNDTFCTQNGVPGSWSANVFTDSKCTDAKSSSSVNVGEKIWFKDGCIVPGDGYSNVFLSVLQPSDIQQYGKYVADNGLSRCETGRGEAEVE